MKRINILLIACIAVVSLHAQNATQARHTLDKTAAVIGRKGGASANFTIKSPKLGSSTGTIAIKGNKFKAASTDAVVWYNGKTQWTYMPQTEEVNVTTPTKSQQAVLNPYTFITLYQKGYDLSMQTKGTNNIITLKAQDSSQPIQQMVITINKQNSVPSQVRMLQDNDWTTIDISGFEAKNQPDATFTFTAKEYPDAEVIDLR